MNVLFILDLNQIYFEVPAWHLKSYLIQNINFCLLQPADNQYHKSDSKFPHNYKKYYLD